MNKQKKTICKSVRYSAEEYMKLKSLAEKSGKFPSAYIRDKALNTKILTCDTSESMRDYHRGINEFINDINDIARTVNTEKRIYNSDIEDLKKAVSGVESLIDESLKPLVFKEKRKPIWLL